MIKDPHPNKDKMKNGIAIYLGAQFRRVPRGRSWAKRIRAQKCLEVKK